MDIVRTYRTIKGILFSLLLLMSLCPAAAAQEIPEYKGAYAGQLVWQGEVNMVGDVLILQGSSLTVHAGTQVNVFPAEGTKIDPEYLSPQTELLIRGRLDIQGTEEAPVRFVIADKGVSEAIAWSGITLDGAEKSRIQHAVLERADTAIRCVASSPVISDNKISDCRYGIMLQDNSHPEILGNHLMDGEGGIFCWDNSNPTIRENLLEGHDEEALFVDATSQPRFGRNRVRGNAIGLALYPRNLSYRIIEAVDNHENLRWLGSQGQGGGQK